MTETNVQNTPASPVDDTTHFGFTTVAKEEKVEKVVKYSTRLQRNTTS